MLWSKKGENGGNGEKSKNYTFSSSEVATSQTSHQESEDERRIPWSRRLNPLKANRVPPIPEARQPSNEKGANWISQLTFHWVHPILSVSDKAPHENFTLATQQMLNLAAGWISTTFGAK